MRYSLRCVRGTSTYDAREVAWILSSKSSLNAEKGYGVKNMDITSGRAPSMCRVISAPNLVHRQLKAVEVVTTVPLTALDLSHRVFSDFHHPSLPPDLCLSDMQSPVHCALSRLELGGDGLALRSMLVQIVDNSRHTLIYLFIVLIAYQ